MSKVQQQLRNLIGRSWMVALVSLLGGLAGLLYASLQAPAYTAEAYVLTAASAGGESGTALNFAQAYGRVAARQETLAWAQPAFAGLQLDHLLQHLRASTSPDAPLIQLTGTGSTPQSAAAYANAGADALIRYGNAHKKETGVRLVLFGGAMPPAEPTSPNLPLDVAVGAATGILLGGLISAASAECHACSRRHVRPGSRRGTPSQRGRGSDPAELDQETHSRVLSLERSERFRP